MKIACGRSDIILSEEGLTSGMADGVVLASLSGSTAAGMVEERGGTLVLGAPEGEEGEGLGASLAVAALYCKVAGKALAFDAHAFSRAGYNFSYVYNTVADDPARLDGVDVVFYNLRPDDEILDGCTFFIAGSAAVETAPQAYFSWKDRADREEFARFERAVREKPFAVYLAELMAAKGIEKNSTVYRAAGISKYTFSKIAGYKSKHVPSRETVAALAIGLRLNYDETEQLYNAAGYHLSMSFFIDRVVAFFVRNLIHDIDQVNFCLFDYDYPPLGVRPRASKDDPDEQRD